MNKETKDIEEIAKLNATNAKFQQGIQELISGMPISLFSVDEWVKKFLLLLRQHRACKYHTNGRIWYFMEELEDRVKYYTVTSFDSAQEPNDDDYKAMHDIIISFTVDSDVHHKIIGMTNVLYYSQYGDKKHKRKTLTRTTNVLVAFLRKLMRGDVSLHYSCDGVTGKDGKERQDLF